MAVSLLDGVSRLAPFSCKSDSNIGARWRRWKRSFDYFVLAKNVTDPAQQKALLLQTASIDVQDIYHTLTEQPSEDDVYMKAAHVLDNYFHLQMNIPYQRHIFRRFSSVTTSLWTSM